MKDNRNTLFKFQVENQMAGQNRDFLSLIEIMREIEENNDSNEVNINDFYASSYSAKFTTFREFILHTL